MVEWNYKHNVDISIINEEHKQLLNMINETIALKQHNNNLRRISKLLRKITMYALKYFAIEETYMVELNYPEYQSHKEEHHNFSKTTIAYCNRVSEGDYQVATEILQYLKWWLVNHVQVTDRKFASNYRVAPC